MAHNIMTDDKKRAIIELIRWYWESISKGLYPFSKSDYEFLYSLWESGVGIYNTEIQTRLNQIRDIYIENHPSKDKSFKL